MPPWDRYAQPRPAERDGPWAKYGGRGGGMAEGLRSFAAQRTIPRPAEDARDAELRERIVTRAEQADAGMSDTEASLRNFMPQAEMFFRNPVRGLSDVGEAAIDMTANLGAEVLERPVETLTYPLTAPSRAVQEYTGRDPFMRKVRPGFGEEVVAGRAGHAIDRALGATTAAGETALLATPMRTGAPRPAPQPGRMQAAVQDFQRSNIEPFVAGVAADTPSGPLYGRLTQVIGENPISGGMVRAQSRMRQEQAAARAESLADQFSGARAAQEGGDAIRQGVRDIRRQFGQEANVEYGRVWGSLDDNAPVAPVQTTQTLANISNRFANQALQQRIQNPFLRDVLAALQAPGGAPAPIRFGDLRELRTEVRAMRNDRGLMRTVREAELARVEQALTNDIYQGALQAARPGVNPNLALADLQAVDDWYRTMATVIREDLQRFVTNDAEQAFSRARSAAQSGGRGAIRPLQNLMAHLPPQHARDLTATILRDMASRGRDGGFSVATWTRAWERMTPEARQALFGAQPDVLANLEAFYRTTRRMSKVERYTNFSNTFAAGQTVGSAAAIAAAPIPALLAHAAWAAGGRLLMSPNFTRLMAQAGAAHARGGDMVSLYGRQYAAIQALQAVEPEYAADYQRILQFLPPPGAGGSARMPTPALPAPAPALPPPP